jgi:DUF2971 family protein
MDLREEADSLKRYMDKQTKIEKSYLSPKIVYHYTDFKTALKYILPNKQLRLSNIRNQNDPFESLVCLIDSGGTLPPNHAEREKFRKREERIENEINRRINSELRIVCFCMNHLAADDEDRLGFVKQRMWDQYGDVFKGLCIALNLDKILKNNKLDERSNFFLKKVTYKTMREIVGNRPHLDSSDLYQTTNDEAAIQRALQREQERVMFTKHVDYKDENEYRICCFANEEYTHLDISNAIHGIIWFGNKWKENKCKIKTLRKYQEREGFILTECNWSNKMLEIIHESPK